MSAANFNLHCGKRGAVLFRESYTGDANGAINRARLVLRESVREARECQIDVPEVSSVDIYRHNCGPDERAGWSDTFVATVRRGRPVVRARAQP